MKKRRRYLLHVCDGEGGPNCKASKPESACLCGGCRRIIGDCWFYAAFDERWDWICVCGERGIVSQEAAVH